jgi:hypothetical protein
MIYIIGAAILPIVPTGFQPDMPWFKQSPGTFEQIATGYVSLNPNRNYESTVGRGDASPDDQI